MPGVSIPHVTGNPVVSEKEEKEVRKELVRTALEALQTEIEKQTIFKK